MRRTVETHCNPKNLSSRPSLSLSLSLSQYIYLHASTKFQPTILRRVKTIVCDFSSAMGINHRQNNHFGWTDGRSGVRTHVRVSERTRRANSPDRRVLSGCDRELPDLSGVIYTIPSPLLSPPLHSHFYFFSYIFLYIFSFFYSIHVVVSHRRVTCGCPRLRASDHSAPAVFPTGKSAAIFHYPTRQCICLFHPPRRDPSPPIHSPFSNPWKKCRAATCAPTRTRAAAPW